MLFEEKETEYVSETLPLFSKLEQRRVPFRAGSVEEFTDPFLEDIRRSRPIQRLKWIGFLGALDHIVWPNGREAHRHRHSRYDHSLAVAELALVYAQTHELSRHHSRVLAAAGLLHDVGHGPLSHTLEPIFKAEFGISHHEAGKEILFGRDDLKSDLQAIFQKYSIDIEEVSDMIEGKHSGDHAFLFSSPINLDTLEGISRTKVFAAKDQKFLDPQTIVRGIGSKEQMPTRMMDQFWELKHRIYNVVIHHPFGLIFDGMAQAFMKSKIKAFSREDFFLREDQLRKKHPELFHLLRQIKVANVMQARSLPNGYEHLADFEIRAPKRDFYINADVELLSADDLKGRYLQRKKSRQVTIGDLVTDGGE